MKKRISVFLLAVVVAALALLMAPAAGAVSLPDIGDVSLSTVEVTYLEDGSYLETKLVTAGTASTLDTVTVRGSKTTTYYNSSGTALWDLTVHGTFRCTGNTAAVAVGVSYDYNIYSSAWSLKSAETSEASNKVWVEAIFKGFLLPTYDVTVTLTCSGAGVLS